MFKSEFINRILKRRVKKLFKYVEEFYAFLFIPLGLMSVVVEFVRCSSETDSDFRIGYAVLSIIGIINFIIHIIKTRREKDLKSNGSFVQGTVIKVYRDIIKVNRCHPYRIKYKYTYKGKEYIKKSRILFWDKPIYNENDSIGLLVNDSSGSMINI